MAAGRDDYSYRSIPGRLGLSMPLRYNQLIPSRMRPGGSRLSDWWHARNAGGHGVTATRAVTGAHSGLFGLGNDVLAYHDPGPADSLT